MEGDDVEERKRVMMGVVNIGLVWSAAKRQALYVGAAPGNDPRKCSGQGDRESSLEEQRGERKRGRDARSLRTCASWRLHYRRRG